MSFPSPYEAKPAAPGDIEDIWRLMVKVNLAEAGTPGFGLAEMKNWLTGKTIELEEDVLLVRDADGTLVGVEIIDCRPPFVRPHAIGGVDPEHTGRGIGSALLRWAHAWTVNRLHKAPADAKVTLLTYTAAGHDHSEQTMRDFGLSWARYFIDMDVVFRRKPAQPLVPEGIVIRNFDPGADLEPAAELFRESFRDHWGYVEGPVQYRIDWLEHWRTQSDHDPSLWWVAEEDARLVGYVFCEPASEGDDRIGYVASLGVHPSRRGRGLGRALLLTSFNRFYEQGKAGAALGVDAGSLTGATRLYESVGMSPSTKYALWEIVVREGEELATLELDA